MGEAIQWWLALELLGFVAFPLAAVAFRALPDRGYALAKLLGLLVVGWCAYTLAMLQLAAFGRGLLFFSVALLAGFGWWLMQRNGGALFAEVSIFLKDPGTRRYILAAEVLFTLAFAAWAFYRAHNPEIYTTEKFMDFAFMNAIVKSEGFPPNDPWLAGHPINYYYFGYVLMAGLSILSGVQTGIGYNLANVSLFSLTALGTFGVAFNLVSVALWRKPSLSAGAGIDTAKRRRRTTALGSTAPVMVTAPQPRRSSARAGGPVEVAEVNSKLALASSAAHQHMSEPRPLKRPHNEVPSGHALAAAERANPARPPYSFLDAGMPSRSPWAYVCSLLAALMVVGMGNLTASFGAKHGPPATDGGPPTWTFCFLCNTPQTPGWVWFEPSRIITDYVTEVGPDGRLQKKPVGPETINEFPAFSFILGDMHPHVMVLPITLLAIATALTFGLRRVRRARRWRDGVPGDLQSWVSVGLAALIIGTLYAANTWDFPTYLGLALLASALPLLTYARRRGEGYGWLKPWFCHSALVSVLALLTYLPFHLTFKSLVGGQPAQLPESIARIPVVGGVLERVGGLILPNTAEKTMGGFLVIFGIFLLAIVGWLIFELAATDWRITTTQGDRVGQATLPWGLLVPVGLSLAIAFALRVPLAALLGPITAVSFYLAWRDPDQTLRNFALLLTGVAAVIGLAIELVYLRDVFNGRMNTLFKFYYQMWVLWSLGASIGIFRVMSALWQARGETRQRAAHLSPGRIAARFGSLAWASIFIVLVLSGLVYSYYAPLWHITQYQRPTLDGMAHLESSAPGDYEAIKYLRQNGRGSDVVLECCRDEYNNPGHAGRVSSYTGIPTLVSWDGHEGQWRGGQPLLLPDIARRRTLVNSIYQGRDPDDPNKPLDAPRLLQLLQANNVTYVFVGAVERGEGGAAGRFPEERVTPEAEQLFQQALKVEFTSGSTIIYKVPAPQAGARGLQP